MLSFRVLPRSILDMGTGVGLLGSGSSRATHPSSPTTGQTVCKLVTPTALMNSTDTFYPFSSQSLAERYYPSYSNRTPFISFTFILLQSLSFTTDGYTPPPLKKVQLVPSGTPYPLRQKGLGARMLLSVVLTPHRETSPLPPVSKITERTSGTVQQRSRLQVVPGSSVLYMDRSTKWPADQQRAGKAGSVRLG
jgi:hypothetical protein